jgi:predicted phosphodiesterase
MTGSFGLIGDVHQEHDGLRVLLAFFATVRVDRVLCVGDIADGRGDLAACLRLLKEHEVDCVAGNHDRWLLRGTMRDLPDALPVASLREEDRSYLASLPATRTYDTSKGTLLLCHGMGDDDMGSLRPEDDGYALASNFELQDLVTRGHGFVVAGHTHKTLVRRIRETWFVNPGTLWPDHQAKSAMLDVSKAEVAILSVDPSGVDVIERVSLLGNA